MADKLRLTSGPTNLKNNVKNRRPKPTDIEGTIQTFLRLKPNQHSECFNWSINEANNILNFLTTEGNLKSSVAFDHIFRPDVTNEDILYAVRPIVKLAFEGSNVCVMTYGVSGTGKSHTMIGDEKEPGIIPKSIDFLFEEGKRATTKFSVKLSIFEIYNETFIDLLHENGKHNQSDKNLIEIYVKSVDEFLRFLNSAKNRRKTASTMKNAESSRSHAVIKIALEGLLEKTGKNFKSNITMRRRSF